MPTMPLLATTTFGVVDWLVVVGYLALTSLIGVAMAGKQATIREFFLGGRKLPWYAISGSIVATEISALTFVSVPWTVFQPGGNFTYLQLGLLGSFIARVIVGYWLVPVYYKREIYSPYDYMGNTLGGNVRGMTTALFTLSATLAQAARIYLTAEVLIVVMRDQLAGAAAYTGLSELALAILVLVGVSVGWTLLGGITTVIWTDVVLFLAFLIGAIVALLAVVGRLDGGWGELFRVGWEAKSSGVPWAAWGAPAASGPWGKFTFFDWSADPTRAYTIWTAMIASTWGGIGAYGTDQLMAQRMFCCKDARDARWAIISSNVSFIVTLTVALVGVALYAFYQTHSPSPAGLAQMATRQTGDRIFPMFIVEEMAVGVKGLIVAAILAAAISSVMGVLTALSQTVQTAFYNPLRESYLRARGRHVVLAAGAEHADSGGDAAEQRRSVAVGRLLVVCWAVVLGLIAYAAPAVRVHYPSLLDLGLAAAGYCGGALLAGFLLSFLPTRVDGRGYLYAAPLSVMCIFALLWHQPWAEPVCWAMGAGLLMVWLAARVRDARETAALPWGDEFKRRAAGIVLRDWPQTLLLAAGVALMLALYYYGYWAGAPDAAGNPTYRVIAWPWQTPIGSVIAFVWGLLLARRREVAA